MVLRQPIVTVAGHVDHGKTSILDCFRGSCVQEGESGGITQKISFTKFPLDQVKKECSLIDKQGINLEIPGFLFIDTPGHAAFTSLRKRGGSLADLAILVVNIKEGIKPQTAEVLQILKQHKTPFIIALNKLDTISGWQRRDSLRGSIDSQSINVKQEFDESLLTFQGSLQNHGFDSELYYDVDDFTKQVAIVPCSAKTKEGVPELLFALAGLSQKFLKDSLILGEKGKGVILEIKKEKTGTYLESILYDGNVKVGDEVAIASFDEVIVSKIRSLEEIKSLSDKYGSVRKADASTGIRLHLTSKDDILSGMPFQIINNDLETVKEAFEKEVSNRIQLDKQGIIAKADSLGSLEALLTLLREANINVVKAGIGPITKTDIISAKANLKINELDAVIVGFNVTKEDELEVGNLKVIEDDVVYKLIEDLSEWRTKKQSEIERERMLGLASICKLDILHQYVFRNSNPAIFGVKVSGGKVKQGLNLIDENNDSIGKVKALQLDKESVNEANEGDELAISIPGIMFDRKIKDSKYLYADISEKQFKQFGKNRDLLSSSEKSILMEIQKIKQKTHDNWGL